MSEPSQELPRLWRPGELLKVRGDRWRVESGEPFTDCHLVRLAGAGRFNRGRRLAVLCPFDRPEAVRIDARLRVATPRRAIDLLRSLVCTATPAGRLWAAAPAALTIHAWQLEPALALLAGRATRLLLADAVGLGKTIQAGLLLGELRARDHLARALVLVPAGLRDQWAAELRERFAIAAPVVDAAFVRRAMADLGAGTNPWSVFPVIVASLDYVKRPEVLRALHGLTWNLLIVDEAHQCASAPERAAAVRALAANARQVVLLTATPHAGDDAAFASLCGLGALPGEDGIVMFRRSRQDVGLPSDRRVALLKVRATAEERTLHRQLDRYTRAVWTQVGAASDARLAMVVLRKRALSSAASLACTLERRLAALFCEDDAQTQMRLPFPGEADADEQTVEDDEPVGVLAAPGLEPGRERAWLQRLLEWARRAAIRESKIARLRRLLRRIGEPAIVFTEYRDTARRLAEALAGRGPLVVLHGGLSRAERQDAERRFRTGEARLLIATDAAGEGLNLHHRCRFVINLELPWNPMRLEQRIGRVDRLGQTRRVHAVHLLAHATAEERVVQRLVLRQERARRTVGGVADTIGVREEQVAEAVMDEARLKPGPPGVTGKSAVVSGVAVPSFRVVSLADAAAGEVQRLEQIRSLLVRRTVLASHVSLLASRPLLATLRPRRRALPRGLVCVFLLRAVDGHGRVVDGGLLPLHVALVRDDVRLPLPLIERIAACDAVMARARALAAERVAAVRVVHAQVVAAARARDRAMAAGDARAAAPLQPGMFDRRALRAAERGDQRRTARGEDRRRSASTFDDDAAALSAAEPHLVAVLVVR